MRVKIPALQGGTRKKSQKKALCRIAPDRAFYRGIGKLP
jgi:hypothetical protein